MGVLIDGKWEEKPIASTSKSGEFRRADSIFRNWVTADGSAGASGQAGFKAESGRYHLYVSYACPWAHRTLMLRELKGLTPHIDISVVHPDMFADGWTFETDFADATGDRLFGLPFLRDVYLAAVPDMSGRVTVPVLWDKQRATIVSNESSEIIQMFNSAFDGITGNTVDYWPENIHEAAAPINDRIYHTLNNGVYRSGFATSQIAYETAVGELFETLDWLEGHLSSNRYLMGDTITLADWRLLPTLLRFDAVYHFHFKCSAARIMDYPNLWGYTRDLYQMPGIAGTTHMDHIRRHYFASHESINPTRIVPLSLKIDLDAPHNRG